MLSLFHSRKKSIPKLGFLVIGVQKAGTTALDNYFREHPEIGLPEKKELHFFDDDKLFDRNHKADYKLYHKQFSYSKSTKIYGEITPIYTYWKDALTRIHQYNPSIKIIVLLRNPMERAFSQWNMQFGRKLEEKSFSEAIRLEESRLNNNPNKQHRFYSYINRGKYAEQLKNMFSLFPKDQCLIIQHDSFLQNQREELSSLYNFLEVKDISSQQAIRKTFQSDYKTQMNSNDYAFILSELNNDIVELEKILDWDLSQWKKNSPSI